VGQRARETGREAQIKRRNKIVHFQYHSVPGWCQLDHHLVKSIKCTFYVGGERGGEQWLLSDDNRLSAWKRTGSPAVISQKVLILRRRGKARHFISKTSQCGTELVFGVKCSAFKNKTLLPRLFLV